MAIAATTGATNNVLSTTVVCAVTVTITAGRMVVVKCFTKVTGQTVSSVVDSGGSTYTKLAGPIDDGTQVVEIWGTPATGSVASSSVTVTWTAGSGRKGAAVEEYSGVVAIGNVATNSGTGTSPTVSLTTQDANNYVVAGLNGDYDASITASVGTVRQTINAGTNLSAVLMDNTSASAGSVTCTGTQAVSAAWAAAAVELRSVVSTRAAFMMGMAL
jgi:hypothetical protein